MFWSNADDIPRHRVECGRHLYSWGQGPDWAIGLGWIARPIALARWMAASSASSGHSAYDMQKGTWIMGPVRSVFHVGGA